jgi:hypothetical protein
VPEPPPVALMTIVLEFVVVERVKFVPAARVLKRSWTPDFES